MKLIKHWARVFETAYSLGLVLPDGYGLHWVDGTKSIHSLDETGILAYYCCIVLLPYRFLWQFFSSRGPLSVCLCLCLSQVGVLSKRLNESGCFFCMRASFHLCCKEIQVPSVIRVLPSGTLLQTLDLGKIATAYRSSKRVINLARERWRCSERDKLDRRRSTKFTIPPSSDVRPL